MTELHRNYASFIVDSHISEHHESFLSRLDPQAFVDTVRQTGSDSVFVYACCHSGNCYYPTRVGHMHRNLNGRDFFGESIRLLRKHGILPRAYYTVVYHRQAARDHPSWRVSQIGGAQSYRRSWYCCPNSEEYRRFASAQIQEICSYDVASIFIDMTFWPGVCFCHNCRGRFLSEYRREIPTTVDWNDPRWVEFQRARERWLSEFAHEMTAAAKSVNSNVAVAHQFSPVLLGWMYGQTHALSLANDIPSGDFYGGKHQQRLGCKVLAAFEKDLPFEFMTSRCITLYDHTSTKSTDELICSGATTLANGGTFLLIDAINPDGTLEQQFYSRVNRIAEALRLYKQKLAELQPKIVADTGLYFSMASHVRRDHNGVSLNSIMNPANNMLAASDLRPVQEVLGTSIILHRARRLYRVLHDHATDFTGLSTIIVNDASFMSGEEAQRLRRFVHDGGTLIATGMTSYYDLDGNTSGDFALWDVFGVRFTGGFSKDWNYLIPEAGEMVSNDAPSPLVEATTATVLAPLAEPLFEKDDFEHYAAFHSNPPGPAGRNAALTMNQYGRGSCLYLCSSLLRKQQEAQQTFGASLLREHAPPSIVHSTNAPRSVELTLLRGTSSPSYLLCLVNFQDELPNVPVRDVEVTLSLPCGKAARTCRSVASGRGAEYVQQGDRLRFQIPLLNTIEMIEISTR